MDRDVSSKTLFNRPRVHVRNIMHIHNSVRFVLSFSFSVAVDKEVIDDKVCKNDCIIPYSRKLEKPIKIGGWDKVSLCGIYLWCAV